MGGTYDPHVISCQDTERLCNMNAYMYRYYIPANSLTQTAQVQRVVELDKVSFDLHLWGGMSRAPQGHQGLLHFILKSPAVAPAPATAIILLL